MKGHGTGIYEIELNVTIITTPTGQKKREVLLISLDYEEMKWRKVRRRGTL